MICLVWNARGLGSSHAFHELRRLVTGYSPLVQFICETKVTTKKCNWWRSVLHFDGQLVVDSKGASGGLMLLWNEPCVVNVSSFSDGHIDCVIQNNDILWRFTGFYGNPDVQKRHHSWTLMQRLATSGMLNIPWLIGGDFNEITNRAESCDRSRRPWAQMRDFNSAIKFCGLKTIPCDAAFSWYNKRKGDDARFLMLDRFLCNRMMEDTFDFGEVKVLDTHGSDHNPLLLSLSVRNDHFERGNGYKSQECRPLHDRLERCQSFLKAWSRDKFESPTKKLSELRKKRLKLIQRRNLSKNFDVELQQITKDIEKITEAEELHWKQRSRANWLGLGDRNSKYFHAFVSKRRQKNTIKCLRRSDGTEVRKEGEMADEIHAYFSTIFQSSLPELSCIDEITNTCSTFLGDSAKAELAAPFSEEEVRKAIFQMHAHKAPGPDGYPPFFFQKFWGEIGDAVTNEVLNVLNGNSSIRHWNKTHIVLIPKVKKPKDVKDFRPISLCNTSYKMVAKVLANRLRTVLNLVIDESQSAFIPGRLISDNIILGYECMHWIRNKKLGHEAFATAKLDMSKAYDRVEWRFLRAMMVVLRFPLHLVDLVMQCISTVEFSFVINCKVYGSLFASRGLRQGCPLSPFLFVLCAQGFSSLLKSYENQGLLSGVIMARHCPSITNLFFADDSLIFFKAEEEGARCLGTVLQKYAKASGQIINYEKSTISFSPNMRPPDTVLVTEILGISETTGHALYLGLPTFVPRQKKLHFDYLRDRVYKKLNGWDHKFFSAGGKQTFIKSVIQSIPTYAMACFRIPVGICADIEKACSQFWWGDSDKGKKMHWAKWERLCQPKSRGGLGFRQLIPFNQALLAKQVWRLIKHPNSLLARVLKQRYFRDEDVMTAKISPNCSFVWRSICWGRELLGQGLRWKVGNGKSIRAFHDRWNPGSGIWDSSLGEENSNPMMVGDFVSTNAKWDLDKLLNFFPQYVVDSICSIEGLNDQKMDLRFWAFDERGRYVVKFGYLCATNFYSPHPYSPSCELTSWWKKFWALNLPPKVLHFAWRMLFNMIAMNGNLVSHHVPTLGFCFWCKKEWGSTSHGLLWCDKVRAAWKATVFWEDIRCFKHLSMEDLCRLVADKKGIDGLERWLFLLWFVWKFLCDIKHENKSGDSELNLLVGDRMLSSFQKARQQVFVEQRLLPREGSRLWQPPPQGLLRLDVDVSYHDAGRRVGMGFILRDALGKIVAAGCQRIGHTATVLLGELHALLLAIGFCLENDTGPVVVYSDSLLAIHVLQDSHHGSDSLCDDLWEVFSHARTFVVVDFLHARREANRAAHELARLSVSVSDVMIWKSGFPD
ncbi:uncharacterized protein LOC131025639 [Salvia miltiorrhiza]|uniref:uncharacterized protein LOC131025639 n=1 Tax=Salvia miltiorrhiza TaxID=226208 RepID=UPI0025AD016F|nr:uncharacterized protein LOC131025639 [Salvia miltiorrhiza]